MSEETFPCPECGAQAQVLRRSRVDGLGLRQGYVVGIACPNSCVVSETRLTMAQRLAERQ